MERISKHISYKEAVFSPTATRFGIKNIPSDYELSNMQIIANNIFEPLREWVGGAIKINSFFRSKELNKKIGGSKTSQHMEGRAMDIDDVYGYKTNAEMFDFIKNNLDFDQLIWEFGVDTNPDWLHVSYISPDSNRNRILKAERINGKTVYSLL